MRARHQAFSILMLVLGCLAICAPAAEASHTHRTKPPKSKLLPKRSCEGLLSISDFPGAVREHRGTISSSTSYATTCIYYSAEQSEANPKPESVEGFDLLEVDNRERYEYKGKPLNLLGVPKKSATETVIQLHGIGTHAEIVIGEDVVKGVVQVRNDVFSVEKETLGQMKSLLSHVAHKLSPTGK